MENATARAVELRSLWRTPTAAVELTRVRPPQVAEIIKKNAGSIKTLDLSENPLGPTGCEVRGVVAFDHSPPSHNIARRCGY